MNNSFEETANRWRMNLYSSAQLDFRYVPCSLGTSAYSYVRSLSFCRILTGNILQGLTYLHYSQTC